MKKLMLGLMLAAMITAAQAEPMRTLLTQENQFPEKGQTEIGFLGNTQQRDTSSDYTESLYARYGLFGNLAAYALVPMHETMKKTGYGSNQAGIGDVALGFQVLPYEDIFKFPYILPHLQFGFPTGNKDKGYGAGDVSILGGVTVGTKTWECVNWAVDFSGQHLTNNDPTLKSDTAIVSGSIVWDLDDQFSLLSEISFSNQNANPVTYEVGMTYKPIENLLIGVYGGKTVNLTPYENWDGTVKISYSF